MTERTYMDPVALRATAEHLMGRLNNHLRPAIDNALKDLKSPDETKSESTFADEGTNGQGGFIYGRSHLGAHHDACVTALVKNLDDIKKGYAALANALACAAEDYTNTDGENAGDLHSVMQYFSQDTTPGDHDKYVDPDTGTWNHTGPPETHPAT